MWSQLVKTGLPAAGRTAEPERVQVQRQRTARDGAIVLYWSAE